MIIKEIKIFSQNVYKNKSLTNTILEAQKEFDISSKNCYGQSYDPFLV